MPTTALRPMRFFMGKKECAMESMDKDVAIAAISGAGDMAKRNADLAESITGGSLDFAKGVIDTGSTLIGKQLDTSREVQQDNNALASALSTLAVNSANPNATVNDSVKQVAMYGLIAVGITARRRHSRAGSRFLGGPGWR